MKTKLVAAFAAFVLVFSACQKDPDENTPDGGNATDDYQPTTVGSTWTYNSTTSGTYTETVVDKDTTINGENYKAFDNSANGRRYISKNGNVYKLYGRVQELEQNLNLTYLKDAAAGTTWQEDVVLTVQSFPIPVTFKYTIASRDADKVVNNVTYNNVIAVDIALSANSPLVGGNLNIATGRQFHAKGVGTISSSFALDALGTEVNDSTYLVSHEIK